MKHPRVVVVTGGGTGIGFAIAQRFSASGDKVIIVGRREAVLQKAVERLNQNKLDDQVADYMVADLSRPNDVTAFRRKLEEGHITTIDILVNNAGGSIQRGSDSLQNIAEQFIQNYEANVLSAVLTTEVLKDMFITSGGRVISLSSIGALKGGGPAYSAAKAAVIGWSYALANELSSKQITVNVIAPGFVPDTEFFGTTMNPERHEQLVSQTLLKRPGTPEDIAGTAFFLASQEAAYITGQVIQVMGGALVR